MSAARPPEGDHYPSRLQTFLAFDYGQKRTGVATGNRLTRTAQGLPTITASGDSRFERINACLREWQPDALVVGVPFHPDGAGHENTDRARSTTEAIASGARDADAASACIILEQFLRSIP